MVACGECQASVKQEKQGLGVETSDESSDRNDMGG